MMDNSVDGRYGHQVLVLLSLNWEMRPLQGSTSHSLSMDSVLPWVLGIRA